MKTIIFVLFVIVICAIVLALHLGFAYLGYWLTLKAGAPQYVAVIVGIAVFVLGGISTSIANSKK